ncbi:energy transducer TonB [Flavivirga jejuensis]|uniref:Energy transducer TonB n=1 Tax=Flavivirga jejuensis TaxID=870487 RepID=A0ABT8WMT9_9FLAO|nr:energy transducer TonB [Flavivirga jejuensis]MDO5974477.1 energy transducer TonB [Flavivirga jejuensis]
MSTGISNHVVKNFNIKIAKRLGLANGKIRINTIFKVDKEGNIKDIRVKASHPKLKKETFRVLKLIPKMKKSGYQKDKPIIISYSLPIIFNNR